MKHVTSRPSKGDSRQRILEAATSLFTTMAYNELSVEEIAREAGVAHGLVFHYFGTKARLYEEVSQESADRLDRRHERDTRDVLDPQQRLAAFLESHMRAVESRRADYIFRSRGGVSTSVKAIWERSRRNAIMLLLGFLGVDTPSEPLVAAMRGWLGFFDELVLVWMQDGVLARDAVLQATMNMFPPALSQARLLGATDAPNFVLRDDLAPGVELPARPSRTRRKHAP